MNTICMNSTSPTTIKATCDVRTTSTPQHSSGAKVNSGIGRWLSTVAGRFATRYNQYIDRRAFQSLLTLDAHMLRDIGVTRQDVKWASRLPMSEDAAAKLEIIARRR